MQAYEAKVSQATADEHRSILGAIGVVFNSKGETLYRHTAGYQSMKDDSKPLDPDSTFVLASAGKFITHIAALKLVEAGLITLDEPVYGVLPELETLPLLVRDSDGKAKAIKPKEKITLRHLLLHTSGLEDDETAPIMKEYMATELAELVIAEDAHPIVKMFSVPLVFEPGQGFAYGYSINWTQLLVNRLSKQGSTVHYLQEKVFDVLGMKSTSFRPEERPDIWDRRLHMVQRNGETGLSSTTTGAQGLSSSVSDMKAVIADLISPTSKLLKDPAHIDLLFQGQFAASSPSLRDLRGTEDNYAFSKTSPSKLNWSAAGLVIEQDGEVFPKGTVTWDGMPNLTWAMNRDKGLAMFFVTQLVPYEDARAKELSQTFMKEGWSTFCT